MLIRFVLAVMALIVLAWAGVRIAGRTNGQIPSQAHSSPSTSIAFVRVL